MENQMEKKRNMRWNQGFGILRGVNLLELGRLSQLMKKDMENEAGPQVESGILWWLRRFRDLRLQDLHAGASGGADRV